MNEQEILKHAQKIDELNKEIEKLEDFSKKLRSSDYFEIGFHTMYSTDHGDCIHGQEICSLLRDRCCEAIEEKICSLKTIKEDVIRTFS